MACRCGDGSQEGGRCDGELRIGLDRRRRGEPDQLKRLQHQLLVGLAFLLRPMLVLLCMGRGGHAFRPLSSGGLYPLEADGTEAGRGGCRTLTLASLARVSLRDA